MKLQIWQQWSCKDERDESHMQQGGANMKAMRQRCNKELQIRKWCHRKNLQSRKQLYKKNC